MEGGGLGWAGLAGTVEIKSKITVEIRWEPRVLELTRLAE